MVAATASPLFFSLIPTPFRLLFWKHSPRIQIQRGVPNSRARVVGDRGRGELVPVAVVGRGRRRSRSLLIRHSMRARVARPSSLPSLSKCSQKQANILALFRTTFPETFPRINSGVEWKAESEPSVCGAVVGCLPPLWEVVSIFFTFFNSLLFWSFMRKSLVHAAALNNLNLVRVNH